MTEAIVWTDPGRADFVGRVAQAAGLSIVGAGGPGRTGSAAAQRLGSETIEDLRGALADGPGRVVLIADAGAFGTEDASGDAEAVLAAAARNATVIALEPVPASVFAASGGGWLKSRHGRRAIDVVRFVPVDADHGVLSAIDEVMGAFGPVRIASGRALGRPEHAGLGAAMVSGLAMLGRMLGAIEVIDAAVVGADAGTRSGPTSDRLRDLHGHASTMCRGEGGAVGRLFASDAADAWDRSIELLGPAGRMVVHEGGFVWTGPDGAVVDSSDQPSAGDPADDPAVAALAGAIRRHLDQPEPPGRHLLDALTVAQAALLSARTGQPESPAAVTRAVSV